MLTTNRLSTQLYQLILKSTTRNVCKIAVTVDPDLNEKLDKEELKHRHHPGIIKKGNVNIPKHISKAIERAIGDFPIKTLVKDGKVLNQYICSRHPPPETKDIQKKIQAISQELDEKYPMPNDPEFPEEELERKNQARQQKLKKTLKERIIAWKPITYGAYEGLVYAIGRSAQEYAVISSIFKEIKHRNPDFKPRSFIDFGSGVGSAMWAASDLWKESIFEYLNVDSSREMNDLSDLIIRDGNENQKPTLKNVYYRQFLPGSETKYDLVVSAFSLFEMPSAKDRKEIIMNLWKKCDGYMIIIEEGSRKGSEIINEVRSTVLSSKDHELAGHVFAPCPHDLPCPRLAAEGDNTPCNFNVAHEPLGLGEKISGNITKRFSYVVLKKGPRKDASDSWPRLVRPTLIRSKHSVCRMCTSKGTLLEIVFTKSKHGRNALRCARASDWGDRLPIEIGEEWENVKRPKRKPKDESVEMEDEAKIKTEQQN
ncbi:methyltransferase-like protein 17, mitochondrial [Episyrphus balteatus]|uniref:methyltransferase-like protein 17, mitochondrial n=1 Tax=Episyrphus balteatus TaxID=286459 RepID=UPI0024868504|nr:methyltransferase-like protein 17, mitochondrial [Episyrphus balteatus]